MKNAKRWIAVLLCLACVFTLAACASKEKKLVGRWGISGELGEEYSEAYWEFTDHGTFLITDDYGNTEDAITGNYSADDDVLTLYISDGFQSHEEHCTYDIQGKYLTIYIDGEGTQFVRK